MTSPIWLWIAGSFMLWSVSTTLSVIIGLLLAVGTRSRIARPPARVGIHFTRGVPTSLFVVAFGMISLRMPTARWLPIVFPGTSPEFQSCAWAIVVALAIGSSGHIAVIFLTAWESVGIRRLDQARVLGFSTWGQTRVVGREALPLAIGALGPRLVHQLHNTGFAALFPVVEVFGGVVEMANESFLVAEAAALGAVIYIGMSQAIWMSTRALESRLGPPKVEKGVQRSTLGQAA